MASAMSFYHLLLSMTTMASGKFTSTIRSFHLWCLSLLLSIWNVSNASPNPLQCCLLISSHPASQGRRMLPPLEFSPVLLALNALSPFHLLYLVTLLFGLDMRLSIKRLYLICDSMNDIKTRSKAIVSLSVQFSLSHLVVFVFATSHDCCTPGLCPPLLPLRLTPTSPWYLHIHPSVSSPTPIPPNIRVPFLR